MWSSLVEGEDICSEEAEKLLLLKDQEVIQALAPDAAQKAFTHRICLWGSVRRLKNFDAARGCYSCTIRTEFLVIVSDEVCGCLPRRRCLPQWLRDPEIRRGSGNIDVDDVSRFQQGCRKKQKMDERRDPSLTFGKK